MLQVILVVLDKVLSSLFWYKDMARTNKRGIAAKKAVQQKQAARLKGWRRFEYPKRKLELEEAKEFGIIGVVTNPKWADYNRFLRGRKICWETRLRIDPDWFRFVKTPSGGSEVVTAPMTGRIIKKLRKSTGRR